MDSNYIGWFRWVTILFLFIGLEQALSQSLTENGTRTEYELIRRAELLGVIPAVPPIDMYLSGSRGDLIKSIPLLGNNLSNLDVELIKLRAQISENRRREIAPTWFIMEQSHWSMFSYSDAHFSIHLDPIFRSEISNPEGDYMKLWSSGLKAYGSIEGIIDYNFIFFDNHEDNTGITKQRKFSRESGIREVVLGDYSEMLYSLEYRWNKGKVVVGKDYLHIGSGEDSRLIMSEKAPSFPFIAFEYQPVPWFNFFYLHGWLNSGIPDSSTLNYSLSNLPTYQITNDRRSKYIALHTISFLPVPFVRITLGESMVYSDNIEIQYVIPVSFFRLADHYNSLGDTGDNAQVFSDINVVFSSLKSRLFATFFIDELQLGKVLSGDPEGHKQYGMTLGLSTADLYFTNSRLTLEYTRVNPYVYSNYNPAQQFTSSGYQLGHWIGSNADQIHAAFSMRISRPLWTQVTFDYIRKGGIENIDDQYSDQNAPFLFGVLSEFSSLRLVVLYEPVFPLQIFVEYEKRLKSTNRFINEYGLKLSDFARVRFSYGL